MITNKYVEDWATRRKDEMKRLLKEGVIPYKKDFDVKKGALKNKALQESGLLTKMDDFVPHLSGQVCGSIDAVLPAKQIVDQMMAEAIEALRKSSGCIVTSKL